MNVQNLKPLEVEKLVRNIESSGFARIADFVPAEELAHAQAAVRQSMARNGGESVMLIGAEATTLVLPSLSRVAQICHAICAHVGASADCTAPYNIIRCLGGRSASQHSLTFHFDSYMLTALVPVIMPSQGRPGDLILAPNMRPLRRTYARNLVDKALVDNPLSQRILKGLYDRQSPRLKHLALAPGDLYFFWGYRTLHTNETVDDGEVRSTALVHLGHVHRRSALRRVLLRQ
jgi:hypothetical protein